MAKTKKNSSSFSGDKQPDNRRGKAYKTIVNEAIAECAMLDLPEGLDPTNKADDREKIEKKIAELTLRRAFNPDDQASGMLLNQVLGRYWPPIKPQSAPVEFDVPDSSTPWQAVQCVLKAISGGDVPISDGVPLMNVLSDFVKNDEIIKRLEKMEAQLGASQ